MQTWTAGAAWNSLGAKSVDFALAIAGWPTIYTVQATAVPSSGGSLNTGNGFNATAQPWMNLPKIAGARLKGRPEEGGCTIGQLDVEILDRLASGARSLTDLMARDAYLNGTSTGYTTTLNGAVSYSATSLTLTDATNFAAGANLWVGQECIKLGDKVGSTFGGVTPNTRAYMLTDQVAHSNGVKVYSFTPSLFRRPAYLFKGYQALTLDNWAQCGFGMITGDTKQGAVCKLQINSLTWEAFRPGTLIGAPWNGSAPPPAVVNPSTSILNSDYTSMVINVGATTNLSSKNHFFVIDGEVIGIRSAV